MLRRRVSARGSPDHRAQADEGGLLVWGTGGAAESSGAAAIGTGYRLFHGPGPTPPANASARPAKPAAASDQGADELKPVVIQPQEKKAPTWRGVAERDSGATANRPAVAPPAPATDATT